MEVAYSREAMHALLALGTRERLRAVAAAEALAERKAGPDDNDDRAAILPIVEGGDVKLVPFSSSGDLVVAFEKDKATVLALIDVIGALEGTDS